MDKNYPLAMTGRFFPGAWGRKMGDTTESGKMPQRLHDE